MIFRNCHECGRDILVASTHWVESDNEPEFDRSSEPDDASEFAPEIEVSHERETTPAPPPSGPLLCLRCVEKAAAKTLQCTVCSESFKALPSGRAYNAKKPVCNECEWANNQSHNCSKCCAEFQKSRMRPHRYQPDPYDHEDDLCPACVANDSRICERCDETYSFSEMEMEGNINIPLCVDCQVDDLRKGNLKERCDEA